MGAPRYIRSSKRSLPKRRKSSSTPKKKKHPPSCIRVDLDDIPWPYVEVRWMDATSTCDWGEARKPSNLSPIVSRGFLYKKTQDKVCLASSLGFPDDYDPENELDLEDVSIGEMISIPRGCIPKDGIRELVAEPKRRRK